MAEVNWVDKECKETEWWTPRKILDCVDTFYGGQIPLDPATHPSNPTKAKKFFTKDNDGLSQKWDEPVFVNPPYGKGIRDWCEAIWRHSLIGLPIIALLPCGARFSTRYWQNFILSERLHAICFVRSRVKFLREDGTPRPQNPYDSAIYAYNVIGLDRESLFTETFCPLGKCLRVSIAEA
jgi:site-specific DNA-methyltransferase (adenine-specific)